MGIKMGDGETFQIRVRSWIHNPKSEVESTSVGGLDADDESTSGWELEAEAESTSVPRYGI